MRRRTICADQSSPRQTSYYDCNNSSSFPAIHLDTVLYFSKKENTAGTYTSSAASLRCCFHVTLLCLTSEAFVCTAFSFFSQFFPSSHVGPLTPLPSVIAQRYCVAKVFFFFVSCWVRSLSANSTRLYSRDGFLRTSLAWSCQCRSR